MDLRDFHNRLRIMIGIDRHELEAAGVIAHGDHIAWGTFHRDPFRWLIRCDDRTAAKLWTIIEQRAGSPPPDAIATKRVVPPPPPPQTISKGGMPRLGGSS